MSASSYVTSRLVFLFSLVLIVKHHTTKTNSLYLLGNESDSNSLALTEISQETAVNPVDIVSTLQSLQMLKYWKGKHLVLKRQVGDNAINVSKSAFLSCSVPLAENAFLTKLIAGWLLLKVIPLFTWVMRPSISALLFCTTLL